MATDETKSLQIISSARRTAESGRELSPDVIHELERIAESGLSIEIRLEAEILIGLEAMG